VNEKKEVNIEEEEGERERERERGAEGLKRESVCVRVKRKR